jgi:hypothetical protein
MIVSASGIGLTPLSTPVTRRPALSRIAYVVSIRFQQVCIDYQISGKHRPVVAGFSQFPRMSSRQRTRSGRGALWICHKEIGEENTLFSNAIKVRCIKPPVSIGTGM